MPVEMIDNFLFHFQNVKIIFLVCLSDVFSELFMNEVTLDVNVQQFGQLLINFW